MYAPSNTLAMVTFVLLLAGCVLVVLALAVLG